MTISLNQPSHKEYLQPTACVKWQLWVSHDIHLAKSNMLELSFNDNNQSNRLPVVPLIPVSVINCGKLHR